MIEVHYLLNWNGDYVRVEGKKVDGFEYASFEEARAIMIADPEIRTTSFSGDVIAEVTLQYMNESEMADYENQRVIFGPHKGKTIKQMITEGAL